MRLNNIILHGTFKKVEREFDQTIAVYIYNNKISRLNKGSFNISVSNNIRLTLIENNFSSLIKGAIEGYHHQKIKNLEIRVTNFNHNSTINATKKDVLDDILPFIHENFGIEEIAILQDEVLTPFKLSLVLNPKQTIDFSKIQIKLFKRKFIISFQIGKNKKQVHITAILTAWETTFRKLLKYLSSL